MKRFLATFLALFLYIGLTGCPGESEEANTNGGASTETNGGGTTNVSEDEGGEFNAGVDSGRAEDGSDEHK